MALPTVAELLAEPSRCLELDRDQAAAVLAQIGALGELLRARLITLGTTVVPEPRSSPRSPGAPDHRSKLLTLDEMVERSRKSRGWFHSHWRRAFPTARKIGRTVLVPEADFERWLRHGC